MSSLTQVVHSKYIGDGIYRVTVHFTSVETKDFMADLLRDSVDWLVRETLYVGEDVLIFDRHEHADDRKRDCLHPEYQPEEASA